MARPNALHRLLLMEQRLIGSTHKRTPNPTQIHSEPFPRRSFYTENALSKVEELKKNIQAAEQDCKQLEKELSMRYDLYATREAGFQAQISEIEATIKHRSVHQHQSVEEQTMLNKQKVQAIHREIQSNVLNIQKKTTSVLEEQNYDIKRKFDSKVNEINRKIEEVKKTKEQGIGDYQEMETKFTKKLGKMDTFIVKIQAKTDELKVQTTQTNETLSIRQTELSALNRQLKDQKKETAKLRDEIHLLKHHAKPTKSLPVLSQTQSARFFHNPVRYNSAISHLNRHLQSEEKQLNSIKREYSEAIRWTTPLEETLHVLLDQYTHNPDPNLDFIEFILSKPEVISFLYD